MKLRLDGATNNSVKRPLGYTLVASFDPLSMAF